MCNAFFVAREHCYFAFVQGFYFYDFLRGSERLDYADYEPKQFFEMAPFEFIKELYDPFREKGYPRRRHTPGLSLNPRPRLSQSRSASTGMGKPQSKFSSDCKNVRRNRVARNLSLDSSLNLA